MAGAFTLDGQGPQARCQGRLALTLLLTVLLGGCLQGAAERPSAASGEGGPSVWIVDHGWHTGLVLPTADLPAGVWPERDDFPGARFLEVAWGDRDFYTTPDAGLWLAVKAALASRGSVLHVVGLDRPVRDAFAGSEVVEVEVSRAGLDALARFIDGTYTRGGRTRAPRLGPGLYGDGAFYPAGGSYSLLYTCNTWTVAALREAGCPTEAGRTLTAGGVLRQVRGMRCGAPPTAVGPLQPRAP
jgi:uncharacterized protein (TIGR02117 family)